MKQTLLMLIAILTFNLVQAQTSVHHAAYFNSVTSFPGIVTNYMEMGAGFANDRDRTFETWVKRDTVDADYHTIIYAPNWVFGSTVPILHMYLHGDSIYSKYGSFTTGGYYPPDTNWHHISFIGQLLHDTTWVGSVPVSVTHYDSNVVYIDGVLSGSRTGGHTSVGSGAGTSIYIGTFWASTGGSEPWNGHISRIAFYDTVLHASSFIPDCVFDTTLFYSGGNISMPCIVLLPLNGDNNSYYVGIPSIPLSPAPTYTYETSPCAPTYTFYCPPSDTILYTGTDTVLKVVNTNASYMKGSYIAMHKNGWLNPTMVAADYTVGVFTDTLLVTTPGSYPYISSYRNDTQKIVVVLHDGSGSVGIHSIYQNKVQLYPNPVKNQLTLNIPISDATMSIVNLMGREVLMSKLSSSLTHVDVSELSSGIYIIMLNGSLVARFIKE